MKLRINASDKNSSNVQDAAIENAYGNKFIIPLDFEMLFNDYDQVSISPGSPAKPDAKYKITDVSLEHEIITQPDLARRIAMEYQSMVLPYDRVLKDKQIPVNKSDKTWSWSTCRSLKAILALFDTEQSYKRDTSRFYNPKVQKVTVILEGKPNQLYTQGMRSFEQYHEIRKYFAKGKQKDNDADDV